MRPSLLIVLMLFAAASASSEALQESSNSSESILESPEAVNEPSLSSESPAAPESAVLSNSASSATMKPVSLSLEAPESSGSFSTSTMSNSASLKSESEAPESEAAHSTSSTTANASNFPGYVPAEFLKGLVPEQELLQRKADEAARRQAQADYVAQTSDRIKFRGLSVNASTLADFFMIIKQHQPNLRSTFVKVAKPYAQWKAKELQSQKPAIYGSFHCFEKLPGQIKKQCGKQECAQKFKRLLINVACQEDAPELEPQTIQQICCPLNGQ
ncbi:hypothetical protein B9Z55_003221 [Caenorhabditis nigoni]|uniref:Uncharacterized protein n=1 Tax=Caenorhabditis nigoni TaxID=1611254 RepID=A0A2G5VP30_9PELO|nr:hypothetical protein B9Z55_003221 [Caenorhabditis nigoni]